LTVKRLSSLDLVRGIAAFAVAVPHYFVLSSVAPEISEIISVLAVEVFFVLSGYVLAPQIIDCVRSKAWRNIRIFLMRRWMRTIPPYLFALIVISLISQELFSTDFFRDMFYVQNLFFQANKFDYYPVAWSLSVEEWFYVTFPVIAFVCLLRTKQPGLRHCIYAALGYIAIVTLIRFAFGNESNWGEEVRRVVVFRVDSIAYGFILYVATATFLPLERLKYLDYHALAGTLLFLVGAAVAFYGVAIIAFDKSLLSQRLFPLYAAALGSSAIFLFYTLAALIERSHPLAVFSVYVGRISYSVYLFHIILAQILHPRISTLTMFQQLPIYIASVVLFCTVFYYYYERPILAARPAY
jgi:peptidoglycan/LPS O-acetylase OafA/YrhL